MQFYHYILYYIICLKKFLKLFLVFHSVTAKTGDKTLQDSSGYWECVIWIYFNLEVLSSSLGETFDTSLQAATWVGHLVWILMKHTAHTLHFNCQIFFLFFVYFRIGLVFVVSDEDDIDGMQDAGVALVRAYNYISEEVDSQSAFEAVISVSQLWRISSSQNTWEH